MSSSQKDENRLGLYTAVVLNAVILYCLITTQRIEPGEWLRALADVQLAIPAVVGLAFITLVNSQLSAKAKERLVFWEWSHPLPGSRAFSWFLPRDQRIDAEALAARYGSFPTDPGEQNRLWYRIYSSVRDDPAIASMRRTYLFARDYAALVVLMLVIFGIVAFLQLRSPLHFILYTSFLILQLVLTINSARTTAERWVTTAMAIAASR